MDATDFLRDSFRRLHQALENVTSELTVDQLNFTPDAEHHSISWILWHAYRTEDLVRSGMLQKQPDRWAADSWAARLGMPEKGQGTGQSHEDAHRVQITDHAAFTEYAHAVAADTDAYLTSLTPDDLERKLPWPSAPGGEDTLAAVIGNHVMTHVFGHRNEIYWLRSLQGLKGSPN